MVLFNLLITNKPPSGDFPKLHKTNILRGESGISPEASLAERGIPYRWLSHMILLKITNPIIEQSVVETSHCYHQS